MLYLLLFYESFEWRAKCHAASKTFVLLSVFCTCHTLYICFSFEAGHQNASPAASLRPRQILSPAVSRQSTSLPTPALNSWNCCRFYPANTLIYSRLLPLFFPRHFNFLKQYHYISALFRRASREAKKNISLSLSNSATEASLLLSHFFITCAPSVASAVRNQSASISF